MIFLQKICSINRIYMIMIEIFEKTGYEIHRKVLNAWDYGATPKREYLITIGIMKMAERKLKC